MSSYHPLHDGWTLTGADVAPVPATVPGCVHTDLLAAGVISDPFLDDNEARTRWIGHADWVYETRFRAPPGGADRVDLVCQGLDTVATLTLNGRTVGATANMHRSYRFPVTGALSGAGNHLVVRFSSAYRYAEQMRDKLGDRPAAYERPYNFIRKMACNFGWDWGPELVTAGIWRPVGLHAWSVARLDEVVPRVRVDGRTGIVEVVVRLERARDVPVRVAAELPGISTGVVVPAGETEATLRLSMPDVALWWPRGLGDQPLHPLAVRLSDADGEPLDEWHRRIGFRSVQLDTRTRPDGTPFTVLVNGVPVFVRGANWIPDDTFPTRITRKRYAQRLTQACQANLNFLRVWGGGIYESDDFYDLADELGLLVGQDFLFSCAAYPEEPPFWQEVAAEARENVVRLAPHPSLVMWVGNNENIWGHHDWGWRDELGDRTWGEGYYHRLLPRTVATADPTRPYWPGSPYSGDPARHPNEPDHGSTHIWDVWNTHDYTRYRTYRPRFVAEFGFQGPATYATLRRAVSDEPLTPVSPGMQSHQKAHDGDAKLTRGLAAHFTEPRSFDDWHYLTQVNQARAVQLGVEHFRSLRPYCMGSVMWQLNDCWPVVSWAAVDGDGRRKPLWYALRRANADRLLTVQPSDEGLLLVAVNETAGAWRGDAEVTRQAFAGGIEASAMIRLDVPAWGVSRTRLKDVLAVPGDARSELLFAESDSQRAWWFFGADRDLAYPTARWDATVEPAAAGQTVTVTARTLLRDLTLFPDRLDPSATVDDALVTLLPGERVTFTVSSDRPLDPIALTAGPVLRCVNDRPHGPGGQGVVGGQGTPGR